MEALDILMNRIRTEQYEDLAPERLNRETAEKHGAEGRFFTYEPAPALHHWDYENWDSYQGGKEIGKEQNGQN